MWRPSNHSGPARVAVSSVVAVSAALVVFLTTSVALRPAIAGLGGVIGVTAGVLLGLRLPVTLGATASFGATLLAGIAGADPLFLLAGGCGSMIAWDLGGFSTELRTTFEVGADVGTLATVHAAGVLALVGGIGAMTFALSQIPVGDASGLATLLLVAGGILLVSTLR